MSSLLPVITASYFLIIGILVLYQSKFDYLSRIFFALCFTTFMWQGTWAILFQQTNPETGEFLAKLGYLFILFLPTTLYHFLAILSQRKHEMAKIFSSYAFAVFLSILLFTSDKLIAGVYDYFWGYYPKAGILHPLHVVQTLVVVCRGLYITYCAQKNADLEQRTKLRYCIASLFIYSLAAIDYLCNYKLEFYPPGIIFITISLTITCYAMVKYKLIDLSRFISVFIGRLLCIVIFVFLYLLAFYFYNIANWDIDPYTIIAFHTAYIALICLSHPHLLLYLQKIPDQLLLEELDHLQHVILDFSKKMHTVIDYKACFNLLSLSLIKPLDIYRISLFISLDYDADKQKPEQCFLWDNKANNLNHQCHIEQYVPQLFQRLNAKPNVLLNFHKSFQKSSHNKSIDQKIISAIPCVFNHRILGIILLQNASDKKHYAISHAEFLDFLSFQSGTLLNRINLQNEFIETTKYKEKNQLLRALAGTIAHEIRNPFNAVAGYNAAIEHHLPKSGATTKTYPISSENLRHIQNSLTKSNKAIQLGGKITDAILLSLKNETLDPNNFNTYKASEIINYVLEHYGYSENTERALITTDIQADFPLLADHDLLIYVHYNLIKNALYYKNTPDFHITITATTGTTTNQITIKDHGPGITPDKIHQIFNDFYSDKKGGTGLGLPFCKRTMQALKGDIHCNSQENAWTTFTLTFPKIDSPVLDPIKASIKQQAPQARLPELKVMQEALAGKNLLIIDDEESNRYAIIMLLQDSQCNLHEAKDGKAALHMIKQQPYDAIFSDLNMPEMNGDEMLSEIKHNPEYKKNRDTPILMITGKTGTKDRELMLEAGATDILSKPLNKATLIASLYKHMPKPVETDLNQSQKKVLSAEQMEQKKTKEEQSKIKLLSEQSGIDLVYAVEQYDRTLAQIKRELETLITRSEGLISAIQDAYDQQDYKTIETRLHKIVYLPQLYNLESLTLLIRKLETQAAEQRFEDFGADLLRLEALLGEVVGGAKIVMENAH